MVYFHTEKSNLERLGMEFLFIWNILRSFGKVCGRLIIFSPFWYVLPRKSGNPGLDSTEAVAWSSPEAFLKQESHSGHASQSFLMRSWGQFYETVSAEIYGKNFARV
jgi:hypothetical protein